MSDDLHGKIMNLQCCEPDLNRTGSAPAYRLGYTDARHEAAELAAQHAAQLAETDECDADGCAAHISAFASRVDALTAQLAQRDAALKAADDLVRTVESLTGNIWSTPIPNALAAYRNARKATP